MVRGIHVKGESIRLFIPEYLLQGFRNTLKKKFCYEGDNIEYYILNAMADYIE